jgi:prepilin signal peptidase PulO-like enzyme (type II secretory pathway)
LYNHYWSIFALLFGACIGSFANVVIYRWTRGLSLRQPLWSFCPACNESIAWYDNIPVLSFLLLGGRCRKCQVPISLHYPLVELATALVVLLVYDSMFVAMQRIGVGELPDDWAIMSAHWVLFAGLIVLAVMDLEAYLVDIRVTWIISAAGVVGHMLWTPGSAGWIRPGVGQAGITLAALIGLAVGGWLFLRGRCQPMAEEEPRPDAPADVDESPGQGSAITDEVEAIEDHAGGGSGRLVWLVIPIVLVLGYVVAMFMAGSQDPLTYYWPVKGHFLEALERRAMETDQGLLRLLIGLVVVFVGLTLAAGRPHAQADSDIVEAITSEAHDSRRNVLWELKLLSPAIMLSIGFAALLITQPAVADRMDEWLRWKPFGGWQPLWGLATGIAGWIIGGAIGWLARILFTLVFGKEALGMGDVHILAATGAVAGWPVAFLGFFLAAPLALLGLVVICLRRQSRMLPYGPWLGLGFLLASMFQDRILLYFGIRSWL